MRNMHGAHQNIKSVEKISLENVGEISKDSKKSHEDLARFQETLNSRGMEMLDVGTNSSKAMNSVPQVYIEPLLGNVHLLGPKC